MRSSFLPSKIFQGKTQEGKSANEILLQETASRRQRSLDKVDDSVRKKRHHDTDNGIDKHLFCLSGFFRVSLAGDEVVSGNQDEENGNNEENRVNPLDDLTKTETPSPIVVGPVTGTGGGGGCPGMNP